MGDDDFGLLVDGFCVLFDCRRLGLEAFDCASSAAPEITPRRKLMRPLMNEFMSPAYGRGSLFLLSTGPLWESGLSTGSVFMGDSAMLLVSFWMCSQMNSQR